MRHDQKVTIPLIGVGTDVHRLDESKELWLAGLHWPGEAGLDGHSDGDCAAHAMVDAVLSAAGLGDIGQHFGTDSPLWSRASGVTFLTETAKIIGAAGYRVGNVSVQVIGNKPRIGSRRLEAEAILGAAVGARVSISGTTTDGLGLTGRGEGIAAIATALLFAPS